MSMMIRKASYEEEEVRGPHQNGEMMVKATDFRGLIIRSEYHSRATMV